MLETAPPKIYGDEVEKGGLIVKQPFEFRWWNDYMSLNYHTWPLKCSTSVEVC